MEKISPKTALIFPGQGPHGLAMLSVVKRSLFFQSRYELVCEHLKDDPFIRVQKGDLDYLNQNKVSSLLTVLVSSVYLDLYRAMEENQKRSFLFAGYSVGQWTALYAAQAISFETLLAVVKKRAELMDACFERSNEYGMLAMIGIPESVITDLCILYQRKNEPLFTAAFNCPGQYSLSGSLKVLERVSQELRSLNPKKVCALPVSGAWHCPLLSPAEKIFRGYLESIPITIPNSSVLDNVTGEFLPSEAFSLKEQLSKQITSPVRWEKCVRTLAQNGIHQFVEIGFGNMLTKFGFFIDRQYSHQKFQPKGTPHFAF